MVQCRLAALVPEDPSLRIRQLKWLGSSKSEIDDKVIKTSGWRPDALLTVRNNDEGGG